MNVIGEIVMPVKRWWRLLQKTAYFPKNGAVIVVGLNSQPDDKQNHNGALLEEVYGVLHKAGKI